MFPTSKFLKGFSFIKPAAIDFSIAATNSSTEPTMVLSFPSSVRQMGNGIPQKRERERFQSLALASQFPKRPSPVDLGFQLILLLLATILSRTSVTLMNQESRG